MAEPRNRRADFRTGWRGIRPRLIGVLLVPTMAAVVFGALRVQVAVAASSEAARAESIAAALPDSFKLAVQLTVERDALRADVPAATLEKVEATTAKAVAAWESHRSKIDDSRNADLHADLVATMDFIDRLDGLRDKARTAPDEVAADYTTALNVLLGLAGRLPALDDERIYRQSDALSGMRVASEALGSERRIVAEALVTGKLTEDARTALTRAQDAWSASSRAFYLGVASAARAAFDDVSKDTTLDGSVGAPMQAAVERLVTTGDVDALRMTPAQWQASSAQFVAAMAAVIVSAAQALADDVAEARTSARHVAEVTALVIVLVLLAALVAALLAARSILRPLTRLREAALEIAHEELPERVAMLEKAEGPVDVTVEPLGLTTRDEIGQVAEAFEAVHAEAVRLAGEQAAMRASVNRMFVNLSRRSQSLVERQLHLIDRLEASEQDPDDLAQLFQLDHLATRMRRNDESLLVLAGGESSQSVRGTAPVHDVIRAAAAEVEQFARVEVRSTETAQLSGRVAGDLVHLLAELVENATNFSPPDTKVIVRASRRTANGPLVIEVHDFGVGMSPEQLEQANTRLRGTQQLDADVARRMGLFVTARLAARHGLDVELRANLPRGVVAAVVVPAAALSVPEPTQAPAPPAPASAEAAPVTPSAPAAPKPARRQVTWSVNLGRPATKAPPSVATAPSLAMTPSRPGVAATAARQPSALDLPARAYDEDDSPIFARLQSEWFSRRTPANGKHRTPGSGASAGEILGWSSPGDDGWRRAAQVSQQQARPAPTTATGLPKRIPGQNLVPGAATDAPPPQPAAATAGPDERRVQGLASFQQGVQRARSGGTEGGHQ